MTEHVVSDPEPITEQRMHNGAHPWRTECSCGWESGALAASEYAAEYAQRHVVSEQLIVKLDTPTNRQAILAHVHHWRGQARWPSAVSVAGVLSPRPRSTPDELQQIPREFVMAVRVICQRMRDEDVLTYSAHGYIGVGEKAPF